MSDAVVKHLAGRLAIELETGELLPVQPLSLPDGEALLDLWLTVKRPLPVEPAEVTAWREAATAARDAGTDPPPEPTGETVDAWQAECAAIYQARTEASRELTKRFPAAVGLSAEDTQKLTHGDPLRLVGDFFYAGSGATLRSRPLPARSPAPTPGSSPTGTR